MTTFMTWRGKLLSCGLNAKTIKGDKRKDYATAIMYLSPSDSVAGVNVCANAKRAKCETGCLFSAGRGQMNVVQNARIRKTEMWRDDRANFLSTLVRDIKNFVKWCDGKNVKPAVRLNGTSDIPFEIYSVNRDGVTYANIMEAFPGVTFYDYTKIAKRARKNLPANYSLTVSYSEANPAYQDEVLQTARASRVNLAVVFRDKESVRNAIASGWKGFNVIDGDETDLRFTDPRGCVVALYAKGRARKDGTGFVIDL